jgi:hypothetical protein
MGVFAQLVVKPHIGRWIMISVSVSSRKWSATAVCRDFLSAGKLYKKAGLLRPRFRENQILVSAQPCFKPYLSQDLRRLRKMGDTTINRKSVGIFESELGLSAWFSHFNQACFPRTEVLFEGDQIAETTSFEKRLTWPGICCRNIFAE